MSERRRHPGIVIVCTFFVVGMFVGGVVAAYVLSDIVRDFVDDWSAGTPVEAILDDIKNYVDSL